MPSWQAPDNAPAPHRITTNNQQPKLILTRSALVNPQPVTACHRPPVTALPHRNIRAGPSHGRRIIIVCPVRPLASPLVQYYTITPIYTHLLSCDEHSFKYMQYQGTAILQANFIIHSGRKTWTLNPSPLE
jgi:hypothetical protein